MFLVHDVHRDQWQIPVFRARSDTAKESTLLLLYTVDLKKWMMQEHKKMPHTISHWAWLEMVYSQFSVQMSGVGDGNRGDNPPTLK